jgi:parallel beta-helix repeat protein
MKINATPRQFATILIPALMLVFSGAAAAGPTPVTACGTVLSSGGDYYLPANITCSASPTLHAGIFITANDVHLNLNGHTLDGMSNGRAGIVTATPTAAIGFAPNVTGCNGANNVQITNGKITGFYVGVYLCATQAGTGMNAQVNHLNITGNTIAMQTYNSDNNHIQSNNFYPNPVAAGTLGGDGLDIGGSNNQIQDNLIYGGNNYNAIYIDGNNNQLQGNVVAMSLFVGIGILGNNNQIQQNIVSGSGSQGIYLFAGATGNQIQQNTVFNNALNNNSQDLGDGNACTLNKWQQNLFATASNACIQ